MATLSIIAPVTFELSWSQDYVRTDKKGNEIYEYRCHVHTLKVYSDWHPTKAAAIKDIKRQLSAITFN